MIKVAILGYGTVGSGVAQVLSDNKEIIASKLGEELELKYILDLRDFPGDVNEDKVVHDIDVILSDPEIKIICETMGGVNPAYKFSKDALEKGISVCTSNKELVENHGVELIATAKKNGCNYLFEASVGGGIPILRALNTSLAGEEIVRIMGILNGTTNYILTKMAKEGADYASTLREAQELGYAERNPEADVEGHDAGRKIAILASLITGKTVKYSKIHVEGISKITAMDFKYAKVMGKSIKLVAEAKKQDDAFLAMVSPLLIGEDHPLNGVNGVYNAVFVTGNMLGDAMFTGKGAGKLATASAVVSDVLDCARNLDREIPIVWTEEPVKLADYKKVKRQFLVRVTAEGRGQVINTFGPVRSIDVVDEEFAFITDSMTEEELQKKCKEVKEFISFIRLA